MPKIQIEATNLQDTDVSRVSMVKHAASRLPFRITKGENEAMLDLSSLVKRVFKTAEAKPAIAAVLVHKSVDLAKLQPMFEKHGLVFTQKGAEGDVLTFTQPDVVATGREAVLKFDDHVAFVVTGLQDVRVRQPVKKDFDSYDIDSCDFMEVLNTSGFYGSVCISVDALRSTIYNVMDEADDASEAAPLVEKAIDAFKAWIMPCIEGVPTQAFKAEAGYYETVHASNAGTQAAAGVGPLGGDPDNKQSLADRQDAGPEPYAADAATAGAVTALLKLTEGTPGHSYLRKAVGDIFNNLGPEISPTNAAQDAGRVDTGTGGKNPAIAGTGEAPIGTGVKPETAPAEEAQSAGRQDQGHGGKDPSVTGTGEASVGTGTAKETSPVNNAQGGQAATVSSAGGDMSGVLKAMLMEGVADIKALMKQQLAPVLKDVGEMKTTVADVTKRLVKAEEAVAGTALHDAGDDTHLHVVKNDRSGAPPLLDTAFNRHAA